MATIQFMSPHCDEASFVNTFAPEQQPEARRRVIARRLLRELRQLIYPAQSGIRAGELDCIDFDPRLNSFKVSDTSVLPPKLSNNDIVPGAQVEVTATLVTLNGTLRPQWLSIRQDPSRKGQPFIALNGDTVAGSIHTFFNFPIGKPMTSPLDDLVARPRYGQYAGKSLRHVLNRFDS